MNGLRLADTLLAWLNAALLAALLAAVAIGVVSRGFDVPVAWSDELARYLLVWLAFAGTMLAARRRSHIRIGVIQDRLPPLAARALEIAIQLAVATFGLAIAWHGIALVERNMDVEAISMPVPQALLYMPLPAAGILLALQALVEAVGAIIRDDPA